MANRKMMIATSTAAIVAILAGIAWAKGYFSPTPPETSPHTEPSPPTEPRIFHGCIPTDTGMAARPVDHPRHAGDVYIYRDGTQVRAVDPDGRPATLLPDGSLRYPDGTRFAHNSDTGESTITHPDGRVTHSNIRMPVFADDFFVWGDGVKVPAVDPGGGEGKIASDGSVVFPDGTAVNHDPATGLTKTQYPDGRVTETRDPGTHHGDDGSLEWNDGFRAPGSDPSGGAARSLGDGWIRYPDGTMISHDPTDGDTKIVRPDGSIVTHDSDTCETKVIASPGGCLGSPPVIDKCLIGNWRQTGGGPLEWVKRNVPMGKVQMPQAEVTPLDLTLKPDGRFQTRNGTIDLGFHRPDDAGTTEFDPVTGKARGQYAPTTGFWSAKNGTVRACFDTGDRTTGTVTASTPKHSVTTPFGFAGAAGADGDVSYTCDGNSFKTFQPMPRGGPMEYQFTRISK